MPNMTKLAAYRQCVIDTVRCDFCGQPAGQKCLSFDDSAHLSWVHDDRSAVYDTLRETLAAEPLYLDISLRATTQDTELAFAQWLIALLCHAQSMAMPPEAIYRVVVYVLGRCLPDIKLQ